MDAVFVAVVFFACILSIWFLVWLLCNGPEKSLISSLKELEILAQLSDEDLRLLKLYYPDYSFFNEIYALEGTLYYKLFQVGSLGGAPIREWGYAIGSLRVFPFKGISKSELDAYLNKNGQFQIIAYRDDMDEKIKIAMVHIFDNSFFMSWLNEKKKDPLFTGEKGVIDKFGTYLVSQRKMTPEEFSIIKSIDSTPSQKLVIKLVCSTVVVIFVSIIVVISKHYLYFFISIILIIMIGIWLFRQELDYNGSVDFINILYGKLIFKEGHFFLGDSKINYKYNELCEKYQALNDLKVGLVGGNNEFGYRIISINNELIKYKQDNELLQGALAMLAFHCIIVFVVFLISIIL